MQQYSDTVVLTQRLIRRHSITPQDEGCQDLIFSYLKDLRFRTEPYYQDGTVNLLTTHGRGSPFVLFLGHTDVVPTGDPAAWSHDPFGAEIVPEDGKEMLYGRGSADMKGSDAAMTIALRDFVRDHPDHRGMVGLLLTSNEEGDGRGGVSYVAGKLLEQKTTPDYCLVGEPSCREVLGDTIKVGRRGSLTARITVRGIQGHVAYPERLKNPIHQAATLIAMLQQPLDHGTEVFPPTSFQVTNIKAGTGAENVVPQQCWFMCNWRFNSLQSLSSIKAFIDQAVQQLQLDCDVELTLNGEPFVSAQGDFCPQLAAVVEEICGVKPELSTSGGTSDGRFIAPLGTQVLEFGPRSLSIHQIDEKTDVAELDLLTRVYYEILSRLCL